ncbi:MAG TPA: head GIN domain-containing protein [Allosphingosinicella sp.]|jgi:hypothetical protein
MRNVALLSSAIVLCACHANGHAEGHADARDSGPSESRNFQVAAFDRIALAGSPDVIVTVGGAPSVRAEGSTASLDRLEIVSEGGQLRIGMRSGTSWSWFSSSHRGITVHVTVPSLVATSTAGSGDIRIDRVAGPRFAGSISGSGDLQIAALQSPETTFSVTGSGGITAAGTSQHTNASVTGSGDIDLSGLEATDATLAVVGSGDVSVRATGTAAIDIRGSGDVTVTGPARCTVSKSGSGEAHCNG